MDGGKNADVPSPFGGTILELQTPEQSGGFGNSAIIQMPTGEKIRISHLDKFANLQVGQEISAGTIIGKQGNTGKTAGKTGIHVDYTMYDENGKPRSARDVLQRIYANTNNPDVLNSEGGKVFENAQRVEDIPDFARYRAYMTSGKIPTDIKDENERYQFIQKAEGFRKAFAQKLGGYDDYLRIITRNI